MNFRIKTKNNGRQLVGRELLDLLIEFCYLAVVFLIPLWFAYFFPTYNIFELNKHILFRILVLFLGFLTGLKIIFYWPFAPLVSLGNKPIRHLFKKYWLGPTIFIVGLALTLFFSVNPAQSFYGSYDWQAGWLSFGFNFLWFVLLIFNVISLDNRVSRLGTPGSILKRVERIITAAVLSGSLLAVYGILQIFKIDFIQWADAAWESGRATSAIGQPNFLASFLLLVIPLNFYLIYQSKKKWQRLFWALTFLALLVCLVFTASRGALAALSAVAILSLGLVLFKAAWSGRRKLVISLIFLAGLALPFLALQIFSPGRLRDSFNYKIGSLAARVNFYQAAVDAISRRPWLGYGLENGNGIFIKYYQPDWGIYGDVGASTSQAHNLILDILLTSGVFGLALFTLLYLVFFRLAFLNFKNKSSLQLSGALSFGVAAYLISLLFSFPTSTGEIYFWLFFALLVLVHQAGEAAQPSLNQAVSPLRPWLKVFSLLILIFFSTGAVISQWRILSADYYFNNLYYSLGSGDYKTALVLDDYIKETKTTPPNRTFYNWFLAEKLSQIYPQITELASKKIVKNQLLKIEAELTGSDYRDLLAQAEIKASLGDFSGAQKYFSAVSSLAPHWPKAYLIAAQAEQQNNLWVEAEANYQLGLENIPSLTDPRLNDRHRTITARYASFLELGLGDVYLAQKKLAEARDHYQTAYQDNPADFTILKKIADVYYLQGDLETAINYNRRGLECSPSDYNWPLALALLYQEKKDFNQAENYFQAARQLAPAGSLPAKLSDYGK